ncbi:Type-1 restriction enzyme EcoEI specificity protein [Salmonella enterica subsp. enterica serovar Daytona]|uniref:Type-1 restriction enzyme EcoEI specificity protein n=1 Tax=Salmonella enterica subsp. enterica serovar Daytona TaxID=1962639 RepID=A0A447JP53_SALET|nr:Type-1 restriction enzyme EcoEI specificity protein [Salmonella enterica subsp. enterica serovar Daytona]
MGWEWTTLNTLAEINPKIDVSDDEQDISFVPMPLISTKFDGSHDFEVRKWKEVKKGYTHFANGDIAIAKITPCFENSKAAIFSGLKNNVGVGTTELHVARPYSQAVNQQYLLLNFKSPGFLKTGESQMTGSAGQKRVPRNFFENYPLPFPPLQEQERIVNNFTQLMILCDQLEQHSLTSLDAHQQLVETLLTTLTDSQNADELTENWARISEHFDTLFTTEASIDALKQTILQLAVMGKLVQQDPNDEPASELLKRIAQEKAQLVKDGKIKKQKPLPPISDEEKPFEIPANWEWVRFGTITTSRLGKMLDKAKNKGTPKKYIRNVNVQWDNISIDDVNEMKFEDNELSEFILRNGDLLICEGGEPGRCAIWNKPGEFYFQKALHRVRTFCNIPERILAIHLKNDSLNGRLANLFTGVTIKHLPGDKLQQYVIPLMPLNEQTNIIEKLNFLLDICDSLSKEIKSSQQTQLHLADALTDAAIN